MTILEKMMNGKNIDTMVDDLRERWAQLRTEEPRLRIRDAARKLGVSEAELLVTGENVVRLRPDWKELLKRLDEFKNVMALARNEHCVIETSGRFGEAKVSHPTIGLVTGPDLDLRFFFASWHSVFAVETETKQGVRRSIQIFDPVGDAVFKVFLTEESDAEVFRKIREDFSAEELEPLIVPEKKVKTKFDSPDDVDLEDFRQRWRNLKDTHDFYGFLRRFKLGREDALRLAEEEFVVELAPRAYMQVLETAQETGQPIMVFVGNDGVVEIYSGPVKRLVETDGWMNVLDPGFNLHLKTGPVARAWLVRRPTTDGIVTSVELFDEEGMMIVQFFGARKPGSSEREDWRALTAKLAAEMRKC